MKLKFKIQPYQSNAVNAVVDCFAGQPNTDGLKYRIDPGAYKHKHGQQGMQVSMQDGFKNADLVLSETELLKNIQQVQRSQLLPESSILKKTSVSNINLDIEMETGTGKTYCYIKAAFELNKRYGWSKFIIVVPSIAIREGVHKSLQITSDHFVETYGKKARFFIYNSKQLHHIESFSSDAGINFMVINVQAFNATGKDARRIYDELDDFQSRRPIDVISANRPILILDEPQKMEGDKTLDSLANFKPLMVLRYSATHKTQHNKIHRLDALDAYNQKLVKKIAVRGITSKGQAGTNAYMYLEGIDIFTNKGPEARLEFELKQQNGIKRVVRKVSKGSNLFELSGELDQYKDRFVVADIDARNDTLTFTNGIQISAGEALGDTNELSLRRIQIRETIKAHFEKEQLLFSQGIKVLSLFFIDEVAKYRDYSEADEKGIYARIFEEEYQQLLPEYLQLDNPDYQAYLKGISAEKTHNGYFSIDKKTKRLVDPEVGKKSTETDDVDAYDLILKDKERLLSFEEKTRFIFSHSALREGWDNPNVFVICTLKHSDNTISRRQEVGRGLRLCVNQFGERMDNPATVHQLNKLTVVASESYKDFVTGLQKDISATLSERPRQANEAFFAGKTITTPDGDIQISTVMAKQIYKYLLKNDYIDDNDRITDTFHKEKDAGELAKLPVELEGYAEQIIAIIDTVYSDAKLPPAENDRAAKTNHLNNNFHKKEFQELWQKINKKAAYTVEFNSTELINKARHALNDKLRVTKLQHVIQIGEQNETATAEDLKDGQAFKLQVTTTETENYSVNSSVKYDLLGKISEATNLTRRTIAGILINIRKDVFDQFKLNPEQFISEAAKLINEQKASAVIEHLTYNTLDESYGVDIFTREQGKMELDKAGDQLKKHVFDYVVTDSKIERKFVTELDTSSEVVVYAKLPRGFTIPTPVGDYNPDWAISFKEGSVKHIYFVAETKGSLSSMQLRAIEDAKISCARKFFETLNLQAANEKVKYDVVTDYEQLRQLVG